MLVARVERRDVTGIAADHRPKQTRDPFRSDASEIAVDDGAGLRVQERDGLEDRAERRALARTTPVAAGDGRHTVGGRAYTIGRTVLRPAVGVDDDDARVGKMRAQPFRGGLGDVADRRGVAEARDADHEIGALLRAQRLAHVSVESRDQSHGCLYDTDE